MRISILNWKNPICGHSVGSFDIFMVTLDPDTHLQEYGLWWGGDGNMWGKSEFFRSFYLGKLNICY